MHAFLHRGESGGFYRHVYVVNESGLHTTVRYPKFARFHFTARLIMSLTLSCRVHGTGHNENGSAVCT